MSYWYFVIVVIINYLIWIGNKNGKFFLLKEVFFLFFLCLNELIVY